MTVPRRNTVLGLLVLSALLLSSLIPGGPIENRDFSHIDVGILGTFNVFLTALNLGTFALLYFVHRGKSWAISGALAAGVAYFVVYAIDLAQLFPRSPTPMSQALALVEVLGMCVAVPLMYLCWPGSRFVDDVPSDSAPDTGPDTSRLSGTARGARLALIALLVALGIGIVVFATDAAMGPAAALDPTRLPVPVPA